MGRCQYCRISAGWAGVSVRGSVLGGPVSVKCGPCYRISAGWAGVSIVGLVLEDQCWVGRCQLSVAHVTGSVLGGPVSVKCGPCYRISAGWAGVS